MISRFSFSRWLADLVRSRRGSSRTPLVVLLLIVVVLGGTFIMREPRPVSRLNRPVTTTAAADNSDRDLPANSVHSGPSRESTRVSRSLETTSAPALAAFAYIYAAGNRIEIVNHDAHESIVVGAIHNNAWDGGDITIDHGTTSYGNITSPGGIKIGQQAHASPASVYGDLTAAWIDIGDGASINAFKNLSERELGLDLNGDGDPGDFNVGTAPLAVMAAEYLTTTAGALADGDFDNAIGDGMVRVTVGEAIPRPVFDPRPDFTRYYELTSGKTSYPPGIEHAVNEIAGDGKGHYFASGEAFVAYLDFKIAESVTCRRCAGDGRLGPNDEVTCTDCLELGREDAVEIAGVYYIDDALLDLSGVARNVVIHGTIIVAQGNPYTWPAKEVRVATGASAIKHFPEHGSFVMGGGERPHFTQTYRSSAESGSYSSKTRTLRDGVNQQNIVVETPTPGQALTSFPAIIAADRIELRSREAGFAYHPGDIGDESMTVLQGVVYAENGVSLHGRGGHRGAEIVFNERQGRSPDDALEEAVLNVDLNGDGDVFDRVELVSVTTVPVIEIGPNSYGVDINADGILSTLTVGADYAGFFEQNGYHLPTLIFVEGVVLSQSIHSCEQVRVVHDPRVAASEMPFGFSVNDGAGDRDGLVYRSDAER